MSVCLLPIISAPLHLRKQPPRGWHLQIVICTTGQLSESEAADIILNNLDNRRLSSEERSFSLSASSTSASLELEDTGSTSVGFFTFFLVFLSFFFFFNFFLCFACFSCTHTELQTLKSLRKQ